MPIFPVDQPCAAAHSMVSYMSCRSCGLSIEESPSDPQVPLGSTASSSDEAKLWLARAHLASGKTSEALGALIDLAKTDPRNPGVFRLLADAYRRLGNNAQARRAEETYQLLKGRQF